MNYLPATSGVSQGTSLSGTRVDAPHPAPRADAAPAPAVASVAASWRCFHHHAPPPATPKSTVANNTAGSSRSLPDCKTAGRCGRANGRIKGMVGRNGGRTYANKDAQRHFC